jgi:hypothetical protein
LGETAQDADLPAVGVIQCLDEVLGAASPARQLADEHGECHDLLALNPIVLGA